MGWWNDRVVRASSTTPSRVTRSGASRPRLRRPARPGARGRLRQRAQRPLVPGGVTQVDAVEPSELAWERSAERRRLRTTVPVGRVGRDAERIESPTRTWDAALVTFTLCTIPDAAAALREVRRVLKPGASAALPRARHLRRPGRSQVAAPPRTAPARLRRRMPPDPRPGGADREAGLRSSDGGAGRPPRWPASVDRGRARPRRCAPDPAPTSSPVATVPRVDHGCVCEVDGHDARPRDHQARQMVGDGRDGIGDRDAGAERDDAQRQLTLAVAALVVAAPAAR